MQIFYLGGVLDEDEGGHGGDVVLLGHVLGLVHVDLETKLDSSVTFPIRSLKYTRFLHRFPISGLTENVNFHGTTERSLNVFHLTYRNRTCLFSGRYMKRTNSFEA